MQLEPRLIIFILLYGEQASSRLRLIFKFSVKNSTRFVLFATMPPTLAAAITRTSGMLSLISLFVSLNEKRSVSSLFDLTTLKS